MQINVSKLKVAPGVSLEELAMKRRKLYMTPGMEKRAREIFSSKEKALAFLKRVGLIDENGKMAKEYR